MQFSTTTLLALALAALTSAADIRGFTGSSCQTRAIACIGIKENRCCNFGSSPINSVSWTLPASSRGFGYIGNNKCAVNRRDKKVVFGKKNRFCQQYQTSLGSAKWVVGRGAKRVRRSYPKEEEEKKYEQEKYEEDEDCEEPNAYAYVDDDGEEVWNDIPEGEVEYVKEAYGKGNEELKGYGQK